MHRHRSRPFPLFGVPAVTDEVREVAFAKTTEVMRRLEQIRKGLELPADALGLVAETYDTIVSALVIEAEQREHEKLTESWRQVGQVGHHLPGGGWHNLVPAPVGTMPPPPPDGFMPQVARGILPLKSTDKTNHPHKVKPGEVYDVVARPQRLAFRVEEIEIHDHPERWVVVDIRVGNRSQFARAGEVPGSCFAKGAIANQFTCETCQTAMDVMMVVRYVGPEKEGEVFSATAVGTEAR